jgi:hypothetical protein
VSEEDEPRFPEREWRGRTPRPVVPPPTLEELEELYRGGTVMPIVPPEPPPGPAEPPAEAPEPEPPPPAQDKE